jgi:probable HAF family extracellular repeat protein
MFLTHALRSLIRSTFRRKSLRRPPGRRSLAQRPQVESLEDRCLLSYTVTDLGSLGGGYSYAYGINNRAQVVGVSSGVAQTDAFLYSNGKMTDLGTLGGTYSQAFGINDRGQVVGYSNTAGDTEQDAFLWQKGTMTDLGTLGGTYSQAVGINNRGQVVGVSAPTGDSALHAFLWQNGTMTDLGTLGGTESQAFGINNRGQVVGVATTPGDTRDTQAHAFLWQKGTMNDLGTLGGTYSEADGINNNGQVVGRANTPGNTQQHAFLWQKGTMNDLGTLGGTFSYAVAINASGTVIGASTTTGDTAVDPFMYSKGTMTDLYTLLPAGAVTNLQVTGINDRGQIVGWGEDSNGYIGALLLTPSGDNPVSVGFASAVESGSGKSASTTIAASVSLPLEPQTAAATGLASLASSFLSTLPGADHPGANAITGDQARGRAAGDDSTTPQEFGSRVQVFAATATSAKHHRVSVDSLLSSTDDFFAA